MKLISCLNPVRLTDRSTGKVHYVPCGKCLICRSRHASTWVQRLNQESSCWRYSVFFTLTYDDGSLPRYVLQKDRSLVDLDSGDCLSPAFFDTLDSDSKKLVRKSRGVRTFCSRDVQLFIKRLRNLLTSLTSTIDEKGRKIESKDRLLRYFICEEYGPTGLRPHYHGILWFQNPNFFEKIDEYIHSCWRNGLTDCSAVKSTASSYVASYVASLSNLPKVLQRKPFRPKQFCSKVPSIGSLVFSAETLRKMFDNCSPTYRYSRNGEYVSIPLYASLKSRLFPLIKGFSLFSHFQRVSCYAIYKFANSPADYEQFKQWVLDFCLPNSTAESESLITDLKQIAPSVLLDFNMLTLNEILRSFIDVSDTDPFSPLRRLYYVSKRVCYQAAVFGITVDNYVSHIERYVQRCDYESLTNYFKELEDQSARYNGCSHFIYIDEDFIFFTTEVYKSLADLPTWYLYYFDSFGIDVSLWFSCEAYRLSLSPRFYPEFQDFVFKLNKIESSTHKSKARKEYLELHPDCRII